MRGSYLIHLARMNEATRQNNWGLNSVWKDIVRPRFERLESIMDKKFIIPDEKDPNKYHLHISEPGT